MGYRKLLKDYITHVAQVTGTDLVELGALTNSFNKRDLGELRTIAAELKRESFEAPTNLNHNHLVHQLLAVGQVTLEDLEAVSGVDVGDRSEPMSAETFGRLLKSFKEIAKAPAP